MSALGDYLHLYRRNYIKYGVGEPSYGQVKRFNGGKTKFLSQRLAGIPSIDQSTVQQIRNILVANTLQNRNKDEAASQLSFQQQLNYLYEYMAKKTTQGLLGRYQGGAYNRGAGSGWAYDEGSLQWVKGGNKAVKGLSPNEIKQRKQKIAELDNMINQINKKGQATKAQLHSIRQHYKSITGEEPGILSMSMLGQLQEKADKYTFYTDISNLVGAMGEHIVALCDDTVQGMSKDELKKHFQQAVQGSSQTQFIVDQSQVRGNFQNIGISSSESNSSIHVAQSKDKVDVHIKVNGQDVFANVKHYWDPAKVSLQEETSLLYSLIYLDTIDKIGTHWLNVHAAGTHNKAEPMYSGPAAELNEILKYELAYEALVSGNPLKKASSANIFTFLNRATGEVFIKSTKDILLEDLSRFTFNKDLDRIHFDNDKIGDKPDMKAANARIENVLSQVHATKIKIGFKMGGTFKFGK